MVLGVFKGAWGGGLVFRVEGYLGVYGSKAPCHKPSPLESYVTSKDPGQIERFHLEQFRVQGLGFKVHGSGFRVQGLGFRVEEFGGLRAKGL